MAFRRLFPFDVVADGAVTGSPVAPQINLPPNTQNIYFGVDDAGNLWVNDVQVVPTSAFAVGAAANGNQIPGVPISIAGFSHGGSIGIYGYADTTQGSGFPTAIDADVFNNAAGNNTGVIYGLSVATHNESPGTLAESNVFDGYVDQPVAGITTLATVFRAESASISLGTVTYLYGVKIDKQNLTSLATNSAALKIEDQGTGATDFSIYSAGGRFRIDNTPVPANASAAGTKGEIAWDSGFIYVCISTNTWKRVAIASW